MNNRIINTAEPFLEATGLTHSEWAEIAGRAVRKAQHMLTPSARVIDIATNGVSAATAGVLTLGVDLRVRVKGIRPAQPEFPKWTVSLHEDDPFFWAREAVVYRNQSALWTDAPLRLPQAFEVVVRNPERPVALIFMEDVPGPTGQELDIASNALVARHLGHAQGQYALRLALGDATLRSSVWAKGWLDEYCRRSEQFEMTHRDDPRARNHPLLKRFRATKLDERMLAAWDDRETILSCLRSLPGTIAHNDLWPRQYLAPRNSDGQVETVLLDPAFTGPAPLGLDAGNLATELTAGRPGGADRARWRDVADHLFDSYLLGLHDAGLEVGDADLRSVVRLGFAGGQAARNAYRIGEWLRVAAGVSEGVATQRQWGDMGVENSQQAFDVYLAYGETIADYRQEADKIVVDLRDRDVLSSRGLDLVRLARPAAVQGAHAAIANATTGRP